MAVGAIIVGGLVGYVQNQKHEDAGRKQQLEEIRGAINQAAEKINVLQQQNNNLAQQNNELQRLSICLIQYVKGGHYTDDPDCQKRIEEGVPQLLMQVPNPQPNQATQAGGSAGNSGNSGNGGGNGNPPVQPPGLSLNLCLLLVCTEVRGNG